MAAPAPSDLQGAPPLRSGRSDPRVLCLLQALYPHHGLPAGPGPLDRGEDAERVSVSGRQSAASVLTEITADGVRVGFRYLEVEWEVRKGAQRSFGKDVMKGSSPRVPQQDNYSDCGVYILQYVESFFEVSPSDHLAS